jgi:hypothetical protein
VARKTIKTKMLVTKKTPLYKSRVLAQKPENFAPESRFYQKKNILHFNCFQSDILTSARLKKRDNSEDILYKIAMTFFFKH